MSFSVEAVRELRTVTGAGFMDCKKALAESDGDIQQAIDWLRKKGLASAQKKAGRQTSEGLVAVASNASGGVLVEVNCETDFVARHETFIDFTLRLADIVVENPTITETSQLLQHTIDDSGDSVEKRITELIATIGENMSIRRLKRMTVDNGSMSFYIHNKSHDRAGKIGVLVGMSHAQLDEQGMDQVSTLGHQIAMQIAAHRPQALSPDSLDPAILAREREILMEQAQESGKPVGVIEKMVDGRIQKFLKETTLVSQPFVMNPDQSVAAVVTELSKKLGVPLSLESFTYLAVGEGVERVVTDFAQEVAAVAQVS